MDITSLPLSELKALGYDFKTQIEQIQSNLIVVEREIQNRINEESKKAEAEHKKTLELAEAERLKTANKK